MNRLTVCAGHLLISVICPCRECGGSHSAVSRRAVYWCSSEIADLLSACSEARKLYVRCRRRNDADLTLENELRNACLQNEKTLQLVISRAKDVGREELLASLDRDP